MTSIVCVVCGTVNNGKSKCQLCGANLIDPQECEKHPGIAVDAETKLCPICIKLKAERGHADEVLAELQMA